MTDQPASERRLRLRFTGRCRSCGALVSAGEQAFHDGTTKQIRCLSCHGDAHRPVETPVGDRCNAPVTPAPGPVDVGFAGASARREHHRRAARREARVRAAHPVLGGFLLAITDEPQTTRAWQVGARGEEQLAKHLDGLVEQGVLMLHDRRIRGTRTNIDHIAISSAGVFVIDAKHYRGRPTLRIDGGVLRARTETLVVGGRNCTKMVAAVTWQVELVRAALSEPGGSARVPVRGMLCFVGADWPLIGGSFATGGVDVLWPAKASSKLSAAGSLTAEETHELHRNLARAFPVA